MESRTMRLPLEVPSTMGGYLHQCRLSIPPRGADVRKTHAQSRESKKFSTKSCAQPRRAVGVRHPGLAAARYLANECRRPDADSSARRKTALSSFFFVSLGLHISSTDVGVTTAGRRSALVDISSHCRRRRPHRSSSLCVFERKKSHTEISRFG